MYEHSPPTWLIAVVIGLLALPSSVVMGLLGWWAYRRLFEREPFVTNA